MTTVEPQSELVSAEVFDKWLERFAHDVASADADRITANFREDGHLRDMLALTWDFRTYSGPTQIRAAWAQALPVVELRDIRRPADRMAPRLMRRSGRNVIEAYFDFETYVGRGTAFVRLQLDPEAPDDPRIWTLLTTLQELRGFEERLLDRRPTGTDYSYNFSGNNWLDDRRHAQEFSDREPQVVVIGGGQAGLTIGARLAAIGVDALIVEANDRIGDNWRSRYHSLALHNEVWSNGLPYLPFPPTWPTFLPKDKLAGWLEAYAEFMELNVWTSTRMVGAEYDEVNQRWSIELRGTDGRERTLSAPHLIMATGSVAGAPVVPNLPGLAEFTGEVMHSAQFTSGVPHAGRRAIVVGTGNSGHDVAQDLYSNGAAEVTIVQRSSTCVVSLVPSGTMVYAIYAEGPTEDIDLIVASIPYPELHSSYQWLTRKTCALDKELLDGLTAVGFEIDMDHDNTGFHMKYLRYGGGYYINVGCSELISGGQIKLAHLRNLDRFGPEGMRLNDGTVIAADLIVLATGFETQTATIRRLLGDEIGDKVGELWGFDDHGFMKGMWKRGGQEHLWIMGGGLAECRVYSRFLALQIKADLEGLLPPCPFGVTVVARLGLVYDLRLPGLDAQQRVNQYRTCLDQAAWADRVGIGQVVLREHHGAEDGYLPSPLVLAGGLAAVTNRLSIVLQALVVTLHDPVRLAEDLAVLDLMSSGRLVVVVGAGYDAHEHAMFGRDFGRRVAAVERTVAVWRAAWSGRSVDVDGHPVQVTPRPFQPSGPPIVLGGASAPAARRAARIADGFLPVRDRFYEHYRAAVVQSGRTDPGPLPPAGPFFTYVAEDPDRAWSEIGPYCLHESNMYGALARRAGLTTGFQEYEDLDALRASGDYPIYTPAELVAACTALGPHGRLTIPPLVGGLAPELSWRCLDLIEQQVLPHIQSVPCPPDSFRMAGPRAMETV